MQSTRQILNPRTALVHNGEICYWPNKGYCYFGAQVVLQGATWRCVYDFTNLPVAAGMIAREQHDADNPASPLQLRLSYSDGLGRVLMHKAPCDPTLENGQKTWIGSGRTVYNNKGSVVMQYEPYFSATHACDTAEQAALQGVSPKLYYDPLNRNYRTELPDGSFTKTEWTAWQQVVWDNNDTVLESAWYTDRSTGGMRPEAQAAALKAAAHANTPTLIHSDTLARGFYTIRILEPGPDLEHPVEAIDSYENLDIQGNRLSVIDGRGLTPLSYRYNMLQLPVLQTSIDSGLQRTLVDVAGQPLYAWDSDDRKFEMVYDVLRRPLEKILTDGPDTKTLEVYVYGESVPNGKINNLRTQLYQHFDGSGQQQINQYDFKGNPLNTQQQLFDDPTITDPDWDSTPPTLSSEIFTASGTFDALNRPVTITDPGSNVQAFTYDKSGLLKTVTLNSTEYVEDIHYDAKGQRQAIWYGNGTKIGYTYDPETFRLQRLLTVNLNNNDILQDLNYWYDPVGNISEIQDDAQQTLFFNNSVVSPTQQFTYDALYRLIEAQGRELIGTAAFGPEDNWNDAPWMGQPQPGDGSAMQNYTQHYTYDKLGNILSLQHSTGIGSYTRTYAIDAASNRLLSTSIGATTYNYSYDNRGNMGTMPHLSSMAWNASNELAGMTKGSEPTYYQYSNGQRTRKYTKKSTITEERIYLGNYELYRKYDSTGTVIEIERTTVHVSDDTGRIALLETRTAGSDPSPASLQRYIYSNHLQSAALELDETAAIISYEEYHPYGTTAYQAMNASINAVAKRYKYCAAERDDESGLYMMGARYYIPWLARWTACDPLESKYAGMSPYNYTFNNPVVFNDPSGNQPEGETILNGGQLAEVTITDTIEEGHRRQRERIIGYESVDAGITIPIMGADISYYHRGSEGNEAGWYSEQQYLDMQSDVMIGILHAFAGDAAFSPILGGIEALAQADAAALAFIEQNKGQLSLDFLGLASRQSGNIIEAFNYEYGGKQRGNVNLSPIDPIDILGPALLAGIGKAVAKGASATVSSINAATNLAVASAQDLAVEGIEASLKSLAARGITNPVPDRLARVIPRNINGKTLGFPGASDVFVTAADDIVGLNAQQIAKRLTIPYSKSGFKVIEFKTPRMGLASPINRTNPGFIGFGRTAGGAREFVIPNQVVPSGSTIKIIRQ